MDDNERFRRERAEESWRLEVEDQGLDLLKDSPEVRAALLRQHDIRSGLITPEDHDAYNRRTDAIWARHCAEQRAQGWDPEGDVARLRMLEEIEQPSDRTLAELAHLREKMGRGMPATLRRIRALEAIANPSQRVLDELAALRERVGREAGRSGR